jgi:3-hydroxyisobutyrate dehydrogenase-like beta-hydroxyacid dehydrogenase
MKIGFAGLGRMGSVMAPRLIEAGFELAVWNRTRGRAEALAARGATVAASPAALAQDCDTVISMLTEDAGVESLFLGKDGFLSGPVEGRLFIEMSTLRPATIRGLVARAEAAGAALVDAPVFGTVQPAREGKLYAMAGGRAEDVERARPILAPLTRKVVHMGPSGAGSTMKLVVNLGLAVYLETLAEGLALGMRGGLALAPMLEVIAESPVAAPILQGKGHFIRGGEGEAGFTLEGLRKDLLAVLAAASVTGVPMPAAAGALAAYSAACAAGWAGRDIGELPRFLREKLLQRPEF